MGGFTCDLCLSVYVFYFAYLAKSIDVSRRKPNERISTMYASVIHWDKDVFTNFPSTQSFVKQLLNNNLMCFV